MTLHKLISYLKWTFKTHTVTQTDKLTSIIVNRRYFPSSGTASEVGGIISASSRKKTVSDTRMEMQSVTWVDAIKINGSLIGHDGHCVTDDCRENYNRMTSLNGDYLLARIWRQIKHQNGEKGDSDARNNQVDGVKQCLSSHRQLECDVLIYGK
jgi:hypothetical protein